MLKYTHLCRLALSCLVLSWNLSWYLRIKQNGVQVDASRCWWKCGVTLVLTWFGTISSKVLPILYHPWIDTLLYTSMYFYILSYRVTTHHFLSRSSITRRKNPVPVFRYLHMDHVTCHMSHVTLGQFISIILHSDFKRFLNTFTCIHLHESYRRVINTSKPDLHSEIPFSKADESLGPFNILPYLHPVTPRRGAHHMLNSTNQSAFAHLIRVTSSSQI